MELSIFLLSKKAQNVIDIQGEEIDLTTYDIPEFFKNEDFENEDVLVFEPSEKVERSASAYYPPPGGVVNVQWAQHPPYHG